MPPKPFYEINRREYLFKNKVKTSSKRKRAPEEPVRQWCLFELLSTYGISIQNIEIEKLTRRSSQRYHADIVVNKNNTPYIVIECKKSGITKTNVKKGLRQAADYAEDLGAYFIVLTDGTPKNWIVKRRWKGEWIPVSDIEKQPDSSEGDTITSLLWFLNHARPLLFWVKRSVPAKNAKKFMRHLQEFLAIESHSSYFDAVNNDLVIASEHLARIACSGKEDNSIDIGEYQDKKIRRAFAYFQDYFKSFGYEIDDKNTEFYEFKSLISTIGFHLSELSNKQSNTYSDDLNLMRLALGLTNYLQEIFEYQIYKDIPASFLIEFQNFIERILIAKTGLNLPDHLDVSDFQEFKVLCAEQWNWETDQ